MVSRCVGRVGDLSSTIGIQNSPFGHASKHRETSAKLPCCFSRNSAQGPTAKSIFHVPSGFKKPTQKFWETLDSGKTLPALCLRFPFQSRLPGIVHGLGGGGGGSLCGICVLVVVVSDGGIRLS